MDGRQVVPGFQNGVKLIQTVFFRIKNDDIFQLRGIQNRAEEQLQVVNARINHHQFVRHGLRLADGRGGQLAAQQCGPGRRGRKGDRGVGTFFQRK